MLVFGLLGRPWAACAGHGLVLFETLTDQNCRRPSTPSCVLLQIEPLHPPTVSSCDGCLATAVDHFLANYAGCHRPSRLDRRHAPAKVVPDYHASYHMVYKGMKVGWVYRYDTSLKYGPAGRRISRELRKDTDCCTHVHFPMLSHLFSFLPTCGLGFPETLYHQADGEHFFLSLLHDDSVRLSIVDTNDCKLLYDMILL